MPVFTFRIPLRLSFALFSAFAGTTVWAAACCGSGAAFPSLILGDDRYQFGLSSSYSEVVGDAPAQGLPVFRSSKDHESVFSYQADAATIISDRWQMGVSIPFSRRARDTGTLNSSAFGLGDISTTLGFEAMPEWSYSVWKPRGFIYGQIIFPSGSSIYESTDDLAVDARGKGFYTAQFGSYLLKLWGNFDTSFRWSVSHSMARQFRNREGDGFEVRPTFGTQVAFMGGWAPTESDWRFGVLLHPTYEAASNVSQAQKVFNVGFDLSRAIAKSWTLSMAYLDQTLLGPAQNISLNRSLTLSAKFRVER